MENLETISRNQKLLTELYKIDEQNEEISFLIKKINYFETLCLDELIDSLDEDLKEKIKKLL